MGLNPSLAEGAPNTGRFISLEGGEGAGKSTQLRLLADALTARGLEVQCTREPGGSVGGEAIRKLLLEGSDDRWSPRVEALLFAAARGDHVEKLIRPALARGAWVLSDRYIDSSRAYQGENGVLSDADVMTLHALGSEGMLPSRTLFLDLGEEQAAARARHRDGGASDRIGGRDAAFHARVALAFRRIAADEPDRVRRIDADGSPDTVHARIMAAIADMLP